MNGLRKCCIEARYFGVPLLTLFLFTRAFTAPSDLDPNFGNGGLVHPPVGTMIKESTSGMVIQQDGRIVLTKVVNGNLTLVCYLPNGLPDMTFGNGGSVYVTNTRQPMELYQERLGLQPDGKIIMISSVSENILFLPPTAYVYRYLPDGTVDSTFGINGTVALTQNIGLAYPHREFMDLAIQQNGRIVLVGVGRPSNEPFWSFIVVRLTPNGSLDTTFSDDGIQTTAFQSLENYGATARGVVIQSDGKIVVAGENNYNTGSGYSGFVALARYNPDGSLDGSFGTGGTVRTFEGHWFPRAYDIALQADNKLVLVGHYRPTVSSAAGFVMRYNPDGSLDPSFGQSGVVINQDTYTFSKVAIQQNGRIVCGGRQTEPSGFIHGPHTVARYLSSGAPDTSFDGDGRITTGLPALSPQEFGQSYSRTFDQLAIQRDGKILWTGNNRICDAPGGGCHVSELSGWQDRIVWSYSPIVRYLGDQVVVPGPGTPFDFDGDGRADISVFRPADSVWYLNRSSQEFFATQFGISTDKIVPADYDGDAKTDIAIYRHGAWWWVNSIDSSVSAVQFGLPTDLPVPADYTGDGRDDLAIYRDGSWWIHDLSTNRTSVLNFGLATDRPVAADYDGDGRVDQAVYRNGEWHINGSTIGYTVVQFGLPSDRPVVGDYDGDGKSDRAVYRDGTWYVQRSTQGFIAFQWGLATDIPTPADYDGDGKTDGAIYRVGLWYLLKSSGGISIQQFGLPNDQPVASAFLP